MEVMNKFIVIMSLFWFPYQTSFATEHYCDRHESGGFAPGTKVLSIDESFINIEDTCLQSIIAADPEVFDEEPMTQAIEMLVHSVTETYVLTFEGLNETLTLAPDQIILVHQEEEGQNPDWVQAQNLEIGMKIVARKGMLRTLSALNKIEPNQTTFEDPVYNIELDRIHTFYVGEECQIVVHNAAFLIPVVTWTIGEGVVLAAPYIIATAAATGLIAEACNRNDTSNGAPGVTSSYIDEYIATKKKSNSEKNSGERNPAQDKKLSNAEGKKVKAEKIKHEIYGRENSAQYDLYKDRQGNIYIKPKSGKGPGEPTGQNINNL